MAEVGTGDASTLGIRPEHLALAVDGIPLNVEMTEPTGAETQVAGKFGSQPIVGVFRERIKARRGDVIFVAIERDRIHLFDEQGLRVAREPAPAD